MDADNRKLLNEVLGEPLEWIDNQGARWRATAEDGCFDIQLWCRPLLAGEVRAAEYSWSSCPLYDMGMGNLDNFIPLLIARARTKGDAEYKKACELMIARGDTQVCKHAMRAITASLEPHRQLAFNMAAERFLLDETTEEERALIARYVRNMDEVRT